MAQVKVTRTPLVVSEECLQTIGEIAKSILREQLSQGIDGNGVQHTHPDGTPWFDQSGDLLRSMTVKVEGDGRVIVSFGVDYAQYVNEKAPLSLSPDSRSLLIQRIAPLIQADLAKK